MTEARTEGGDWYLGDAEEQHRAHPRSFFIPSLEERSTLTPGRGVRLMFMRRAARPGEPRAERMWLEVEGVDDAGYTGVLKNQPVFIEELAPQNRVAFEPRHVMAIDDSRWEPYLELRAFANVRLLENDDLELDFVHHEHDDTPLEDGTRCSGWELHAPDETQEEIDDPANIRMPNLAWLMERYPAFGELVFSGAVTGTWSYDVGSGRFMREV